MDAMIASSIIGSGQKAGSGLLGNITSMLNATNSTGYSDSSNYGWQDGASSAQSAGNNYGYSYSDAYSDAASESWEHGYADSYATGSGRTYGREASAEDKARAAEANAIQKELWQKQANFNASQAEIDRAFQERMANTAYQRAVKDLLAAGINPILAAGNMGAATPAGAVASSGLATAHKATTYAESENSNYSRSHSQNDAGSWSRSHSESHSRSENWGSSSSSSSSYNKGYNSGKSHAENQSSTQAKELIGLIGDMINGNTSGKKSGGGNGHKF